MTAFDYGRAQATALRMIVRYGGVAILRRTLPSNGPVYDPGEPMEFETACNAVIVPTHERDRAGTLIEGATSTAYVAAQGLAVVPVTQDRLVWAGRDYTIAEVMPLDPSGAKPVMYEVRLRS